MTQIFDTTQRIVKLPEDPGLRRILPKKDLELLEFLNDQLVKDLVTVKDDIRTNPSVRETFEEIKQREWERMTKSADKITESLDGKLPDDTMEQLAFHIQQIANFALSAGAISAALRIINK